MTRPQNQQLPVLNDYSILIPLSASADDCSDTTFSPEEPMFFSRKVEKINELLSKRKNKLEKKRSKIRKKNDCSRLATFGKQHWSAKKDARAKNRFTPKKKASLWNKNRLTPTIEYPETGIIYGGKKYKHKTRKQNLLR